QSIVIDFEMINPPMPKSPESRQLMLPPALVFTSAPPNVRHGAVVVHALVSSPERETQDRSFSACAGRALSTSNAIPTSDRENQVTILFIVASTRLVSPPCGLQL